MPRFSATRFIDVARAEGVTAFNFMGALCGMLLGPTPEVRATEDHRHPGCLRRARACGAWSLPSTTDSE